MCEASAAQPHTRIAGMLARDKKCFDSYFADLIFGHFDGEDVECLSFTLPYLVCKLGYRDFMRELDLQPRKIRAGVAQRLSYGLPKQADSSDARYHVPAYFIVYLEQHQSPRTK